MEGLGVWFSKRKVIADELRMFSHLVVQDACNGVVLLREPIVAGGAMEPRLRCDRLNERTRNTKASGAWQGEQVLQIAVGLRPDACMKEVVRDANELALDEAAQSVNAVLR